MNSRTKLFASIAVVGTVAVVAAIAGFNSISSGSNLASAHGSRMLDHDTSAEDTAAFQDFIQKHNRNFITKEEFAARKAIFAANLAIIRAHDPVATGYEIGVNKFADLSPEEFAKFQGLTPPPEQADSFLVD